MTLHHFTIAEIQRALHEGELSAREIARQTLDDIARVNPQINAWTEVTAQRMLAEADSIDALRREKRPLPPLAGIPYAVKNLFDVAGHTTLAGAELLSDRPPAASDSWAVRQLHSAGALLSGMLNMDAYAYGFTTENSHYGATRNPHDLSRIAGGSSGGSAAAVAAGLVHFSLGSDTNGSI
ncbi:amidase family protein, partial [Klebsiella pneumoniae]